ncbi:MAG: hypothetical protein IJS87_03435 [Rhodocyclaceae bacterium]|nr:hypothetical protein [Rhodocyclaceae bacterium]
MNHTDPPRRWPLWLAFALVVGVLLLVMVQSDRQWQRMTEMLRVLDEQSADLRQMRTALRTMEERLRHAPLAASADNASGADNAAAAAPDAFARARAAAAQPDFALGGTFLRTFGTGLKTITPLISADAYASEVQGYVLETLLTRDADTLQWQGMLAERWEVSPGGLNFTFWLRPGLQFSDGSPLTADDVCFSYEFLMNEAIAAPRLRAYYERIRKVEAIDARTVRFVFDEPYFDALALAGGMEVLSRKFYEPWLKKPREFNESRGLLFGSGPYRLADPLNWRPDQGRVELERNPRYWAPVEASFDHISWRVMENDSARLAAFRNGETDLYSARPREYRQLQADAQISAHARHFEYMSPTAGYSWIGWNQSRGGKPTRFADVRVRRAMTLLTDVERIINEIFLGYAVPAVSPFAAGSPQHDPAITQPVGGLEAARKLLAEAGYAERNGDGILRDAQGKPFEFELVFFQNNEDTRQIVLLLRDLYARAGIIMKPVPTEWAVMLERMNQRDFDAITLGWTSGIEVDIYQMFHSSQIADGGDNFIGHRNARLDAAIDAARSETDEERRMAHWHEAERLLVEDAPYTFLVRGKSLVFVRDRLANVQPTRLGLNLLAVPVEIYLPANRQKEK